MLKRVFSAIVSIAFVSAAYASNKPTNEELEQTADYKLYKSEPSKYYDNHPAAKTDQTNTVSLALGRDILEVVSSFSYPEDACRFLSVNRLAKTHKYKILSRLLPLMYRKLGYNFGKVYIRCENPKWKPEGLPDEITFKLHYGWFFRAMKMTQLPLVEGKVSTPERALRQFKYFYQAGCLGHMIAAEQAGIMLLNPCFNEIIPTVITFDDLDEDAKIWDVKRLNQVFLNPKFKELWQPMYKEFAVGDTPEAGFHTEGIYYEQAVGLLNNGHLESKQQTGALQLLVKFTKLKNRESDSEEEDEDAGSSEVSEDSEGKNPELQMLSYLSGLFPSRTDLVPDVNLRYIYYVFLCELFSPYAACSFEMDDGMEHEWNTRCWNDNDEVLSRTKERAVSFIHDFCKEFLSYEIAALMETYYGYQLEQLAGTTKYLDYWARSCIQMGRTGLPLIYEIDPQAWNAWHLERCFGYLAQLLGEPSNINTGYSEGDSGIFTRGDVAGLMNEADAQEISRQCLSHRAIKAFLVYLQMTRNPFSCRLFKSNSLSRLENGHQIFTKYAIESEDALENPDRVNLLRKHYKDYKGIKGVYPAAFNLKNYVTDFPHVYYEAKKARQALGTYAWEHFQKYKPHFPLLNDNRYFTADEPKLIAGFDATRYLAKWTFVKDEAKAKGIDAMEYAYQHFMLNKGQFPDLEDY